MKQLVILFFCSTFQWVVGQAVEPIRLEQNLDAVHVERDFNRKYQRALRKLRRVYPLALQAKALIVEFDGDLSQMEKKREKKKYGKQAHKTLKDQFLFDIKDLYIDEGILLMKLIHRETGMTVSEIISKYRGNGYANIYEGMGKIWSQDLNEQYDPSGEDWITEVVINDIIHKRVAFDWEVEPLDKSGYKENMKEYRQNKKEYRKVKRQTRRAGTIVD